MAHDGQRAPWPSRVLARVLDHRKPLDYLWLTAFAALPIALAAWIGVLDTSADGFVGYGHRRNWTILVVILPAAAVALRWIAGHIGPISSEELPTSLPPVVELIETDAGRQSAYAALRRALLSPLNLLAALAITGLIHVADMAQLARVYLSSASQVCSSATVADCVRENAEPGKLPWLEVPNAGVNLRVEKDWSVAYLRSDKSVGKWPNLALNVSAYSVQFAVVFIGILVTILMLRHNWFFLTRVYQRRWVTPGEESSYFHIDLDDEDKCFGFRPANDAFNVQVLALAIAAVFILATRFANVGPGTGLFPDVGQLLSVLAWSAALFVISLPIGVKLLPRWPSRGAEKAPVSLVSYLREFLSDQAWAVDRDTPPEEIDAVAARFAENAFWPTGNNRAGQLYFLSFWVFFVALVPDPRAVAGELGQWATGHGVGTMFVAWALEGLLAWGATWTLFRILRMMLTYIDNRLVELPAHPLGDGTAQRRRKLTIGVFVSYRRDDTAAYTGRLYDSLSNRIDKARLFMDLDKIRGGADFVAAMKQAIDSAQAMLVVIGPKWLNLARGDAPPRIQDPADFVHQEIAHGLKRGIPVFPVLVGGASMPSEGDLPEALKELAGRNAREITDSRWVHDVGQLIEDLATVPSTKRRGIS